MNAYQLFDAAFDSACDYAEPTADYVASYADGAFGLAISSKVAEIVASKQRECNALVEAGESNSNEFYYRVQKPLEEIEL